MVAIAGASAPKPSRASLHLPCRAKAMARHSGASKPNGIATSASSPAGITKAETIGIAKRLASTPYGAMRWKWNAA